MALTSEATRVDAAKRTAQALPSPCDSALEKRKYDFMNATERARKLSSIALITQFAAGVLAPFTMLVAGGIYKTIAEGVIVNGVTMVAGKGAVAGLFAVAAAPEVLTLLGIVAVLAITTITLNHLSTRIQQSKGFDMCEVNAECTANHLAQAISKTKEKPVFNHDLGRADGKPWVHTLTAPVAADKGWAHMAAQPAASETATLAK